jgi:hypothetical protein
MGRDCFHFGSCMRTPWSRVGGWPGLFVEFQYGTNKKSGAPSPHPSNKIELLGPRPRCVGEGGSDMNVNQPGFVCSLLFGQLPIRLFCPMHVKPVVSDNAKVKGGITRILLSHPRERRLSRGIPQAVSARLQSGRMERFRSSSASPRSRARPVCSLFRIRAARPMK